MKAGISTATLFLRQDNEDALSLFKEWKIQTSEVFLTSFYEYEPTFCQFLAEKKGDLPVHSVHVMNTQFEPQLYAVHHRVVKDAYSWLEKCMRSASILGAKYYTFHGVARIKRTYKEDLKRLGEKTQEIYEFCQKFGVTLSYENVEWATYNRVGVFKELKEYCPCLKGVLDLKQARISGYAWQDYLKEMGENIVHVHVSDLDENGKMCLPGQGVFPFDELCKMLKDYNFQGPLLVENYNKDFTSLQEVKRAYEFLAEKAEKFS